MEIKIQEQKPSIKVSKGQKDTYGWEIKIFGDDLNKLVDTLKETDTKLRDKFMLPQD